MSLDIESAHADYTPNETDYESAERLFGAVVGDYAFSIFKGADDSAYLRWDDGVANEWIEHYEKLSHAIARLAHLQSCAESNYEKMFNSRPRFFASKFEQFINLEQI